MDTKQKGDIAEQAATLQAMKRGWAVLRPMGDRLPYDLVFDVRGALVKIQVKSGWRIKKFGKTYFACETRRCKTNRRVMIQDRYSVGDFDFAIVYVEALECFYVLPISFFLGFRGAISLTGIGSQRGVRAAAYREAWHLIEEHIEKRLTNSNQVEQDVIRGIEEPSTSAVS